VMKKAAFGRPFFVLNQCLAGGAAAMRRFVSVMFQSVAMIDLKQCNGMRR